MEKCQFDSGGPARFAFAVGGKGLGDPTQSTLNRLMGTVTLLQDTIDKSKMGDKEKSVGLKRLHKKQLYPGKIRVFH
ncbi:MAG: hypothetical protein CM15mP51_10600 [Porticoccaceae bacterium]|nr:MAG: hypothetical protein CM15mP51_10600 [Porticoccaceae bacterium]